MNIKKLLLKLKLINCCLKKYVTFFAFSYKKLIYKKETRVKSF